MATTGQTTIEFWTRSLKTSYNKAGINDLDSKIVDFRQKGARKNLEYIFGTSSIFKIFLPSIRDIGHEGINWERYIRYNDMDR